MNIDWKARFRNPLFILQFLLAIFAPILAYFGISMQDLTSWDKLLGTAIEAVKNPYVCGLILVAAWNAVNNPTTKGLSDGKSTTDSAASSTEKPSAVSTTSASGSGSNA